MNYRLNGIAMKSTVYPYNVEGMDYIFYLTIVLDFVPLEDPDGEIENSGKHFFKFESRISVTFKL